MIRLDVWLALPSAEGIKAGELVVDDPDSQGGLKGRFRYLPEYLEHPEAFPLDPLHLPLTRELFDADRPQAGVHGVFEDSLPDDWGRRLMVRRFRLGRTEQRVPHLLRLLGNQGMGALTFMERGKPSPLAEAISSRRLEELALLAEKFEQGVVVEDGELALLFQAGSSPGGARPKALIQDEHGAWLAKFASTKDRMDVVSLEAATMELARRAGLEMVETRLFALGSRKCLLVKRFDIAGAGGRNHVISMQSLLKADGYYNAGYRDMAEVLRLVSAAPQRNLRLLYRQMAFNAMIGNTDDHLKNFCMLHDAQGWRLSPAFDLVPIIDFNQEHTLRIGLDHRPPDLKAILAEAGYFGIKLRQAALDLVQEVKAAVSQWPTVFSDHDVPQRDMETVGKQIEQRLQRL